MIIGLLHNCAQEQVPLTRAKLGHTAQLVNFRSIHSRNVVRQAVYRFAA